MERGLSTVFAALAFTLVLSSCLVSGQENETTTEPPTPSNPVGNHTFILYDAKNASKVCLKMQATIVVNITYLINETKTNMSMVLPLTDDAQSNSTSTCDSGATTAMLYVVPRPGQEDDPQFPYYILFRFTGSSKKGDQHWAWGNITFGVESEFLKDYTGGTGLQNFTTDAALHGDPNAKIEFERSYICDSNQSISFPMANNISAFIYVTDLQVQAFEFKNSSSGEFDNARTCILDSAGKANKIVPIAVGAALAGLVVVVLIAYLIGRLRSRRQSSYEALS